MHDHINVLMTQIPHSPRALTAAMWGRRALLLNVRPILSNVHGLGRLLLLKKLLLIVLLSKGVLLLVLQLLLVLELTRVVFLFVETLPRLLPGALFVLWLLLLALVRGLRLDPRVGHLGNDCSSGLTRLCWQGFAIVVLAVGVVF
ncbi:hypothetical protein BC939DRAFT_143844 [Gamsiella multidivaricata]|uniref:uncharacterized protein n=1 Tax=Gamsiella multidivaricata TaxID=101098 RepID=UPI00222114B7|nr:uncharacterized protein BC939DRAFT_143844 [Gamsiella multidivaricata]KAI7824411.1 hypothetical protein BC939DRAFT_143844 [Gamsiella multidivaricata]